MIITNVKTKIISILIIFVVLIMPACKINAVSITEEENENIKNLIYTIKSEGINNTLLAEAINTYRELSKKYNNTEIAEIIEDNRMELEENGITKDELDNINLVLKNVDEKQLNKVLDNINIDEITSQLQSGSTLLEIVQNTINSMSAKEKIKFIIDLLLSAYILKTIITVIVVFIIYGILLRCLIFKKAGRHAWEALIPIYRDVVMLKICNMSPWWLLLALIPIIGWAFLWVVKVASKFMLAEGFDKGAAFGFGLWLLPPIFETILVFSRKTKYVGFIE